MSAAGAPPRANIPVLAEKVTLDGRLSEGEWDDAAVIRSIQKLGNAGLAEPRTTVYLKYDRDRLWVAARCQESEAGYPLAHQREPTDLLSNDDSVQVVLGVREPDMIRREELKLGAGPIAGPQTGAVPDHYYQYTVNAIGATSRFFDETPLDRPLFEARASQGKGEWTIELMIPFSSCGIGKPSGLAIPFNLFRFRPPDMTAWYLPAFGNYAPMPFGAINFLPVDRSGEKTVEADGPAASTPVQTAQGRVASATLTYYPYAACVVGEASAPAGVSGATAILRIPGMDEQKQAIGADGSARFLLDLPRCPEQSIDAELLVYDAQGSTLASATRTIAPVPMPAWYHTSAGIEYVNERVPKPWRAPVVEGRKVRLYDKELTIADTGLLAAAADENGELLADAGSAAIWVNGQKMHPLSNEATVRAQGISAVVESTMRFAGGSLETRSKVDFDGFTIVKMRLRGFDPQTVSRLTVEYPLRKDNARFLHFTSIQDIQELRGFGWTGRAGPVWVGGHEMGLSFSYDAVSPFLSADLRRQIEVVEDESQTVLRLNLIDAPGQLKSTDTVLRFFLTPTPTRRPSIAKTGLPGQNDGDKIYLHKHEQWSDYQSYPDLAKLPELQELTKTVKAEGFSIVQLYFGSTLAENAPGFAEFGPEFKVVPEQIGYKRAYDPGRDVPCWLSCLGGPYRDLLLDGISQLARKAGIRGLFFDGTSVPWECHNPAHKSCGGLTSIAWDTDEESTVIAARNFLKRCRGIFEETGDGRYMILAHCGGALNIPTTSLCDVFYEGEQTARYPRGYAFPLHKFAVGYCGRAFGHRVDMLPELWFYDTAKLLPWSLLHDTMVDTSCAPLEWGIFKDFQDENITRYYPYWRPQPHITKLAGNVLCSYYRQSAQAMLVVSNLGWPATEASLDVSALFPGMPLHAWDEIAAASIPCPDGKLEFGLGAHDCKAIRITTAPTPRSSRASASSQPPHAPAAAETGQGSLDVREYDPAMWEFSQGAGITVDKEHDLGNGTRGFKLTTAGADSASASFRVPLGSRGTIKLRVQRGDGFEISFAGAHLPLSSRAMPQVNPANTGRLYGASLAARAQVSAFEQPSTVDVSRQNVLILSWADGRLDAVYAGEPLAKGLMLKNLGTGGPLTILVPPGSSAVVEVIEISGAHTRLFADGDVHPVIDLPSTIP